MAFAVIFPGQGTQQSGMALPWREHAAWRVVEQAEDALGEPLAPLVLDAPPEALAQTGAIAVLADERYVGKLPLFGGVEKVRWRRLVQPGDELLMTVELERMSARGGWGQGKVTVDGAVACEARLFFALANQP